MVRRARPRSRWRRRRRNRILGITALLLGGALAAALELQPPSDPPRVGVAYAARAVAAGSTLAPVDVAEAELPADSPLRAAALPVEAVLGRVVAGGVAAGELLTESRFVDSGPREGFVSMPVTFAAPDLADFLRQGQVIDVMWTSDQFDDRPAEIVVRGATVLRLPPAAGSLGSGTPVVLEVPEEDAVRLAAATASGSLSVVQR